MDLSQLTLGEYILQLDEKYGLHVSGASFAFEVFTLEKQ